MNNINSGETKMKQEYNWQPLDEVTRKWAIMSQYEKDLKDYAERAARV